jgi:hypothetical protein
MLMLISARDHIHVLSLSLAMLNSMKEIFGKRSQIPQLMVLEMLCGLLILIASH